MEQFIAITVILHHGGIFLGVSQYLAVLGDQRQSRVGFLAQSNECDLPVRVEPLAKVVTGIAPQQHGGVMQSLFNTLDNDLALATR